MINALIISRDKAPFKELERIFIKNGIQTGWSDNCDDALSMLMEEPNDLVILDEEVPRMAGRSFIEQVIMTNPMINCVVASPCDQKEFHDAYEGLGVFMQFPAEPGRKEAQSLCEHMKQFFFNQAGPQYSRGFIWDI